MGNTHYWLTRLFYIRGLGFIYFVVSLIIFFQTPALIGPGGLTPVNDVANYFLQQDGSLWPSFFKYPSVLFFSSTALTLKVLGIIVFTLSLFLMTGFCNMPILLVLWAIQLSFVNGAGMFYSFGWETMLLEMTWLACLLVHPFRLNLLSAKNFRPHYLCLLPLLWMSFRLLVGAGLIKIRGDSCWLDLTCMNYHYETQPNPHPLSWYYHNMPLWFHQLEVLLTHFFELFVPFFFLLFRPLRRLGAILIVFFQLAIISTGNLAFLNWQTIVLAIVALDDTILKRFVRLKTKEKLIHLHEKLSHPFHVKVLYGFILFIAFLSYKPMVNLISPEQRMNQSYDPLHLINSYGLFGSITKKRFEIIISGTSDETIQPNTEWKEYEFYCKPGSVERSPCLITPYHLRLDWQMWFSAMRPQLQEKWLVQLSHHILTNHPDLNKLIELNPFTDQPPLYLKMDLYHYQFTHLKDSSPHWWKREFVKPYLSPISLKNFKN